MTEIPRDERAVSDLGSLYKLALRTFNTSREGWSTLSIVYMDYYPHDDAKFRDEIIWQSYVRALWTLGVTLSPPDSRSAGD